MVEHTLNVKIETPTIDFWNRKIVVPVIIGDVGKKTFEIKFSEMKVDFQFYED